MVVTHSDQQVCWLHNDDLWCTTAAAKGNLNLNGDVTCGENKCLKPHFSQSVDGQPLQLGVVKTQNMMDWN